MEGYVRVPCVALLVAQQGADRNPRSQLETQHIRFWWRCFRGLLGVAPTAWFRAKPLSVTEGCQHTCFWCCSDTCSHGNGRIWWRVEEGRMARWRRLGGNSDNRNVFVLVPVAGPLKRCFPKDLFLLFWEKKRRSAS